MTTEKERMLTGQRYLNTDPELAADRQKNRLLIDKFNRIARQDPERGHQLIKRIFHQTGEKIDVQSPFQCDYGYTVSVGENFFANYNCTFIDVGKITIGKNAMLGPNTQIFSVNHPLDVDERIANYEYPGEVTIGDNLWTGGGVIIVPGVTLGDNVIIAAGAVVTKSFGDNVLIGGNPARIIKKLK
ncbi:maltose O-acetyltransferase [Lentilactobacillus fungorum]|uniref:Acetyltransferase n=1 Tax=Lentilactobacillus fungorum TaxID=2201250 RepID=A0ABQ3VXB4_9LACO|nr:sugar O-acetyltransferase [Lentilactobacillus fungorum]GHP13550.1 maltose O-acetyltransferase [Lentilactobacillus fungorum]